MVTLEWPDEQGAEITTNYVKLFGSYILVVSSSSEYTAVSAVAKMRRVITRGSGRMSMDQFDELTRANMEVALERACSAIAAEQAALHEIRSVIAEGILQAAQQGQRTLTKLTEAGRLAAATLNQRR